MGSYATGKDLEGPVSQLDAGSGFGSDVWASSSWGHHVDESATGEADSCIDCGRDARWFPAERLDENI